MKTSSCLTLTLILLAACASDDTTSGGGGTGTGTASSAGSGSATSTSGASSTSGTSGTASGTGSSSTSGSTSAGTGGVCDGFEDAYGPEVMVKITNTSDAPVYLAVDMCDTSVARDLYDAATDMVVPAFTDCATCETAVQGSCECPGPPCFLAAGMRIDPASSLDLTVGATRYDTLEIPAQCVGSDLCGPTCQQAAPLSDGAYFVRVQAAKAVDCNGQPCDCTPDQTGTCLVEFEGGLVNPMNYDGAFTMPNPGSVEIMVP